MESDLGAISIWSYNPGGAFAAPLYTTADIAGAIGPLAPAGVTIDPADIDLDGLMMNPVTTGIPSIMFSIDPITGAFDGGEIIVWDGLTTGAAVFLFHGAHLWDTAFPVTGTFGVSSENINALEAVSTVIPLPAAAWMALPLLCGLGVIGSVRRMRRTTTQCR